ncbi:MAG: fatty acid desaturase [Terriglobia bacterium]
MNTLNQLEGPEVLQHSTSKKNNPDDALIFGLDALRRRDELEALVTRRLPARLQNLASAALTGITGLAPTSRAGLPVWKGSEFRSLVYALSTMTGGAAMILMGSPEWKAAGAFALVSAMRCFTSGVGHHLTHSTKGLPWPGRWTRAGYNVLGALLLLPTFEDYRSDHGRHHAKVAGPDDPDQQMIEYLEARLTGVLPFLTTVTNPAFHARFLGARLRAAFLRGPVWRRVLATVGILTALTLPAAALATWLMALVPSYQTASLVSWLSLHLWGRRPESGKPFDVATEVTYGRLLLPAATALGLLKLIPYVLVRAIWLQSDLNQHDLHHIGKGPWTEAAYIRARLILEGVEIRQTNGARSMFRRAFDVAANQGKRPPSPGGKQFLGM